MPVSRTPAPRPAAAGRARFLPSVPPTRLYLQGLGRLKRELTSLALAKLNLTGCNISFLLLYFGEKKVVMGTGLQRFI
jgi:hypothetical protein